MKKVFLITGIVLLFALTFGSQTGKTENQLHEKNPVIAGQRYVPDEIIVKFKPGVEQSIIANINSMNNAVAFYTSRVAGFKRLKVPYGKSVSEMVELYRKNPRVEYAEPNYIASAHLVPEDPLYSYQWHLDNPIYGGIHMEAAWTISTGLGVIVAVIDTGVAYENYGSEFEQAPDLASTLFVPGHDFVNNDSHPNDDDGHGTHVTGTIAQSTNNGIGVAGVAYNCSIMPVKVLDDKGEGYYSDVADGIYFAANNGAQVINMSLGGGYDSSTLRDAVAYAYNQGVTIVASSGNGGVDSLDYPAAYDAYVIAVGATRYDEAIAYYSNYGVSLDIVAPGGDIYEDQNNDGYGDGVLQQTFDINPKDFGYWFYQGTSMASPHVSGVAALVIANGVTGPDAVREILQSTADDLGLNGWDETYGWGLLNAAAALTAEPDEEAPTTPTNLAVTPVTGSQIDLTWTESTDNIGVTGYNIYRDSIQVGTAETTSYSDTGLESNTTYSYYVEAYDAAGNVSSPSNSASAKTLDQVTGQGFILSKNSDFSTDNREFATTDTLYIKIYSEFVDFNDLRKKEYKVEDINRKRINGNLTNHLNGTYTASVSLSSLAPGTGKANIKIEDNSRKKYEVKNEVITIIEALDEEPPSVPTGLSATAVSENRIDLNWDASTDNVGVTGYNIFREGSLVGTSATTSFSDTGLDPSTTYEYEVQAFDAVGNVSGLSDPASATTLAPDTESPSTPTGLTAAAVSGTQIDLTWTASTDNVGVTGYNIYRDGSPTGTSETTSFSDTGLQPDTTYSYEVQAFDAAGNLSGLSDPASATTPDQVTGQGFILSKNSDFSTDDREFAITDTLYIKIYSDVVDYNNLRKKEYTVEDINRKRIKGNLTNHLDGTYTASVSLSSLGPGTGKVKIKIEDNARTKYEVKNEPITIIE